MGRKALGNSTQKAPGTITTQPSVNTSYLNQAQLYNVAPGVATKGLSVNPNNPLVSIPIQPIQQQPFSRQPHHINNQTSAMPGSFSTSGALPPDSLPEILHQSPNQTAVKKIKAQNTYKGPLNRTQNATVNERLQSHHAG